MLERLEIHNYALIEDSVLELEKGFSVITGETGAGKSIILGALSLLLGEKTEVQSIRSGCDSATVSASFFVHSPVPPHLGSFLEREQLELEDDTLLVSRTIKSNGRSSITMCGRLCTRSDLALITSELLDISAQRDHQSLLSSAHQLAVLDSFGSVGEQKGSYRICYERVVELKTQYRQYLEKMEASKREEDYLRFAVDEIVKVGPKSGEDEDIQEQVRRIASFEQIYDALSLCMELLHGGGENTQGALSQLHQAKTQLEHAQKGDPSLSAYAQRLESASIELEDIYESLRDYLGGMSYSEAELDRLQGRLALLQRLKKKYGYSLDAVLAFLAESQQKLNLSEEGEILLSKLEKQISLANQELANAALVLRTKRREAAQRLQEDVEQRLKSLGMKEARFSILFQETEPGPSGSDDVSFAICANPGLPMRSIKDVASGGELSRIMLAVKTSLAESDSIPTLIFDEVDAGIGGSVALAVAQQLVHLGRTHQVIVITHLASIASKADTQFVVSKDIRNQMSYSTIRIVKGDARQKEIARMLSGDDNSPESLEHAKKLLQETP
nr:DNA repair protein RecN [uncultured Sphaerochaeta sp.]